MLSGVRPIISLAKLPTASILLSRIEIATPDGSLMIITFVGRYTQAHGENPAAVMPGQFAILQTDGEIARLESGELEGIVYEVFEKLARVKGTINSNEVIFVKRYDPTLVYPFIASTLNLNPISYTGNSIDGITYDGQWNFESATGDLATRGNFDIVKVRQNLEDSAKLVPTD